MKKLSKSAKETLDIIDQTVQKTYSIISSLDDQSIPLGKEDLFLILGATLHTLRDYMPLQQAINLGNQLPMLLRGIYYEGWEGIIEEIPIKNENSFFELFDKKLDNNLKTLNLNPIVKTVFKSILAQTSIGEDKNILDHLPPSLFEVYGHDNQASKGTKGIGHAKEGYSGIMTFE